jgi:hypothetical protein
VRWCDGRLDRDPSSDLHRYRLTTFAFAEALVVSSAAWGCPQLGALRTTLETIGTLHNLEREGPLAITEAADVLVPEGRVPAAIRGRYEVGTPHRPAVGGPSGRRRHAP